MSLFVVLALVVLAAGIVAAVVRHRRPVRAAQPAPAPAAVVPAAPVQVRVRSGEVEVVRPNARTVEGLEIRYERDALVRSARVGAMNSEHKELLLIMDDVQWNALAGAQKQQVLTAARSTWAAKICGAGPDIAYVILKTERGEVVGRASPSSVTVL